jgi:aminoglycoside 6'-N-acetyltransferase
LACLRDDLKSEGTAFTIDPAAANEWAIRAYESVGFRRVGVMRQYWRGPDGAWRDGLLMDLLAEELRE